jgi:hypothetical protein
MKHFFNDLGFPQKFSHMNLKKNISEKCVNFTGSSIYSEKPAFIPNEVEQLPIEQLNMDCYIITPHKVNLNCLIVFHNSLIIPGFIENVIGIIVNKLFNRVKKFIEEIK